MRNRSTHAAAIAFSIVVLLGVPAVVLVLASAQTAGSAARIAPGGSDPHRPTAPFFINAGDGVRPDGIGCSAAVRPVVVARAHLDVLVDRRPVTIPGRVGVRRTCAYWVRTERPGGVIVVASPQRRAFTLGDLFDIWGAPLDRRQVLGFRAGPGRPLRAFVDGREVHGDPRVIELRDRREIALVVGPPPAPVPARFDFSRAGG